MEKDICSKGTKVERHEKYVAYSGIHAFECGLSKGSTGGGVAGDEV